MPGTGRVLRPSPEDVPSTEHSVHSKSPNGAPHRVQLCRGSMSASAARQSWQISAPARSQPAHRVGDNASSASCAARSANGSNSSANDRMPAPCRHPNTFKCLFTTQPSLRSVAGRVVDSALWYPDAFGVRQVKSVCGRYSPVGGCGADEFWVEPSPPS